MGKWRERAECLMNGRRKRLRELVAWMEETIDHPLTAFSLPPEHRRLMRTTSDLERYNQEALRRSRGVRIFPNRTSCLRLINALAMEQSEEWLTGHRYLHMQGLELTQSEIAPFHYASASCTLKRSHGSRHQSVMEEIKVHTNLDTTSKWLWNYEQRRSCYPLCLGLAALFLPELLLQEHSPIVYILHKAAHLPSCSICKYGLNRGFLLLKPG